MREKNNFRNRIKRTATATKFYARGTRGKCPVLPEPSPYEKLGVGKVNLMDRTWTECERLTGKADRRWTDELTDC